MVHSFYSSRQPSGENRVVEDQQQLLRDDGHDVYLLGRETDADEQSALFKTRAALRVATGVGSDPSMELRAFNPDVVHIHNLFPNFGTQWIRKWPGPVVVSLHNYRAVCSRGDLYRDGNHCEECAISGSHRALVHGCYRNSRLATLPLAVSRSNFQRAVLHAADALVTTSLASDAEIKRLVDPSLETTLIPNPGPDEGVEPNNTAVRSGWVAMGRLSPEKGFLELIESWPKGESLDIIGSGPLADQIESAIHGTDVTRRESLSLDDLRDALKGYVGMVFPSRWIEVAPQVVVEAMRIGLPVVPFEGNGIASLVQATGTGVSYQDSSTLASALETVRADADGFSSRAFDLYQREWNPARWLSSITELYRRVSSSGSAA